MIWIALCWTGYYALHSLLAAEPVQRLITSRWPGSTAWYRLAYNLIASLGFMALVLLHIQLPDEPLWEPAWSRIPGGLLLLAGLLIGRQALRQYDLGWFSGLSQWKGASPLKAEKLVLSWWHRRVRHPLYFATLLVLLGIFLLLPTDLMLVASGVGWAYLLLGTRLEEAKLIRLFGEQYLSYRRQVPMLIPRPWNPPFDPPVDLPHSPITTS